MYDFGQSLTLDLHFRDHMEHGVPVQIYRNRNHADIGFIQEYTDYYIKMNGTFYNRRDYLFLSRPGY
jgi:hypothetical protein